MTWAASRDVATAGSGHPVSRRRLQLLAIGSFAGLFSGLFGVGGGTVIVPLAILWLGYREREATGTALAAVALIAAVGAIVQGAYGAVHVRDAALVGLPAVLGVLVGTAPQQRIPQRIGGWRQDRYGSVRRRDAAVIGGLSAGGALAGVALAHVVPTRLLELAFAALLVLVAAQRARRVRRTDAPPRH